MIQQQTPPKPATPENQIADADALRRRIGQLIHEVDFWRDIAERKGEQLAEMVEENRYRLSIKCDVKTCHGVVSVASSEPPADGKLAIALVTTAAVMGWRMGPATVEAMRALTKDATLLVTGKSDRCPNHHEE